MSPATLAMGRLSDVIIRPNVNRDPGHYIARLPKFRKEHGRFVSVDFTRNPNRRHSRGIRSHRAGIETLGIAPVKEDVHTEKARGLLKTRAKREAASQKAFAEAGYHGSKGAGSGLASLDPTVMADAEGLVRMPVKPSHRAAAAGPKLADVKKRFAREERLASKTERFSRGEAMLARHHQEFDSAEAGGMFSKGGQPGRPVVAPQRRPVAPWKAAGRKKAELARAAAAAPRDFDLKSALARFKRTGKLPSVSLDIVKQAADSASDVDQRVLARMMREMLTRQGVEPNPGPSRTLFARLVGLVGLCALTGARAFNFTALAGSLVGYMNATATLINVTLVGAAESFRGPDALPGAMVVRTVAESSSAWSWTQDLPGGQVSPIAFDADDGSYDIYISFAFIWFCWGVAIAGAKCLCGCCLIQRARGSRIGLCLGFCGGYLLTDAIIFFTLLVAASLLKILQLMAGIEPNPGPHTRVLKAHEQAGNLFSECSLRGAVDAPGEIRKIGKGKNLKTRFVCKQCHCVMSQPVKSGKSLYGLHPGGTTLMPVDIKAPVPVLLNGFIEAALDDPLSVPGMNRGDPGVVGGAASSASATAPAPAVVDNTAAVAELFAVAVPAPTPAPAVVVSVPAPATPVVPPAPPVSPSTPAAPAASASPKLPEGYPVIPDEECTTHSGPVPLNGYVCHPSQSARIMSQLIWPRWNTRPFAKWLIIHLLGLAPCKINVKATRRDLAFLEKRLATHANVDAVKRPLEVVGVTHSYPDTRAFKCRKVATLVVLWAVWVMQAVFSSLLPVSSWLKYRIVWPLWNSRIGISPICLLVFAVSFVTQITLFYVFVHRWFPKQFRNRAFYYVPHMVSCLAAEFDRGTNADAVRTSIRQRVRRLACLPIPDEDYLALVAGTELVTEDVIERYGFFSGVAACVQGGSLIGSPAATKSSSKVLVPQSYHCLQSPAASSPPEKSP